MTQPAGNICRMSYLPQSFSARLLPLWTKLCHLSIYYYKLACSRRLDSRAREKKNEGRLEGERGRELPRSRPPPVPFPPPVFPVYNLTRSLFTAALYYLNAYYNGLTRYTFYATGETRSTTSHITCNTKNVIYMVQCNRCNLQYIGETKRRLKDRFNEHRRAVDKTNIKSKPATVSKHFLSHSNPRGGTWVFFGWVCAARAGTPNWHPVLKKISPKTDTQF